MDDVPSLPDEVRATLPPVVAAYITHLETALVAVSGAVAALQARLAELEARLGQNSTTSSQPPSSDPPGTRRAPPTAKGSRQPGRQPGHRGHFRALRPVEQVDRVVRLTPEACRGCGGALAAAPDDPADVRHQVTDLPPVRPQVTEWQLAAHRCRDCGVVTRAAWPATLPHTVVGPHLLAVLALLGVGSDRFTADKGLTVARRQVCWVHLRRDFQKLVDAGLASRPVGERLLAITAPMFEL